MRAWLVTAVLSLCFALSFCGCGKGSSDDSGLSTKEIRKAGPEVGRDMMKSRGKSMQDQVQTGGNVDPKAAPGAGQ